MDVKRTRNGALERVEIYLHSLIRFHCTGILRSGYSDSLQGLDGPAIESRCGRDFPHPSIPALRPTQRPAQWVPGLFTGVKWPGRGVDHPPRSSAEVKERVELYLYSSSGPSWQSIGWPLSLPLHTNAYRGCTVTCGVTWPHHKYIDGTRKQGTT
jgi:hypothetical protein